MRNVISPGRPVRRINISVNMEATGKNIKRLTQAAGLSVKDIMEITGITTEQAIYKWDRGRSIPSTEVQLILAAALGKSIEEILVIDGDFELFGRGRIMVAMIAVKPTKPLVQ